MDAGNVASAMGGFMMGQMFAGPTQTKPALMYFVSIRASQANDILKPLAEVLKEVFLDVAPETVLDLEFTNKGELKVWRKNKGVMEQPLFVVGLCTVSWTKKDYILTLGLRNEVGAPFPLNIALLRNLLINLKDNKIEHEIW